MSIKKTLIPLLILFSSCEVFSSYSHSRKLIKIPKIKVKIASALKTVLISGMDLQRVNHIKSKSKKYSGRKSIKYNCHFHKSQSREKLIKNKPLLLASVKSLTGLISIQDKKNIGHKYKGRLHVLTSPDGNSCDVINEVSLESYISTLLSKEMNGSWPVEALKAQAIAARTYAIHKMKNQGVSKKLGFKAQYDIESSEKHQVSGEFFDITVNTLKAAKTTEGEVLYSKKGILTPLFFHANCGGQTLLPKLVWSNSVSGYKGVKCTFCLTTSKHAWNKKINLKRFIRFLSWAQKNTYIKELPTSQTSLSFRFVPDRIDKLKLHIYLDGKLIIIKKPLLRRYFGRVLFPSNNFKMNYDPKKKIFPVKGKGLGHGVGMCQLGALDLARKGWGYKKILAHYFPDHRLKKVY